MRLIVGEAPAQEANPDVQPWKPTSDNEPQFYGHIMDRLLRPGQRMSS